MRSVAVLIAAFLLPASACSQRIRVDGIDFGPSQRFGGVYFTNFENSKFTQCESVARCDWTGGNDAWVHCLPEACRDLEARINALNGLSDKWGVFELRFTGRKAERKREKRFRNDSTDDVLIEKIEAVALIEGR